MTKAKRNQSSLFPSNMQASRSLAPTTLAAVRGGVGKKAGGAELIVEAEGPTAD